MENHISVFWYQVYPARPETRRTGSASLAIPTLFLVSPDEIHIKRHYHGILYVLYKSYQYIQPWWALTKKQTTNFRLQILKNVKSKLYHFENSKTREYTV